MPKILNILHVLFWMTLLTCLIAVTYFTKSKQINIEVSHTAISIDSSGQFVRKQDIIEQLKNKNLWPITKTSDLSKIEFFISKNPYIKTVEVYEEFNKSVQIQIVQKQPKIRIFQSQTNNFYIDQNNQKMPICKHYSKRCLIISDPTDQLFIHKAPLITLNDSIQSKRDNKLFLKLIDLVNYIADDEFLNHQITQILINQDHSIEMSTLAGSQNIKFGTLRDVEQKFNKLKTLYKNGFNKLGWKSYETIDLRFKNQIVCKTK